MPSRFFLLLSLFFLLAPTLARPQVVPAAHEALLNGPFRPTMAEIKAAFPDPAATNPIPGSVPQYINQALDLFPLAIVLCEKAFPGATWAFLGRDSAYAADMFAAFYNGIGQPQRVVRLDASRSSLNGDLKDYLDFLRTAGYRPDNVENEPPFIILDRTAWRVTSQSRNLLMSAYAHHAATGKDLKSLLRKVNVIGIGGYAMYDLAPQFALDQFFSIAASDLTGTGPSTILSVELGHNTGRLQGHNLEWHGPFGRFERLPDGTVVSTPSMLGPRSVRVQVLHEQIEILRHFSSPGFRARVATLAAEMGVVIPALHAPQECKALLVAQ